MSSVAHNNFLRQHAGRPFQNPVSSFVKPLPRRTAWESRSHGPVRHLFSADMVARSIEVTDRRSHHDHTPLL